jgi:oleandomycin transport system permease protein
MTTLRHSAVIAKRSLIGTWRTPEALVDVTLQPIIFLLLFTYVFGGAIAGGSQQDYLQFLLPGLLGQTIAMAGVSIGVNLNTDVEKGVFDRFRSLPIARAVPLVGAVLADMARYALLCVVMLGFGSKTSSPSTPSPAQTASTASSVAPAGTRRAAGRAGARARSGGPSSSRRPRAASAAAPPRHGCRR